MTVQISLNGTIIGHNSSATEHVLVIYEILASLPWDA